MLNSQIVVVIGVVVVAAVVDCFRSLLIDAPRSVCVSEKLRLMEEKRNFCSTSNGTTNMIHDANAFIMIFRTPWTMGFEWRRGKGEECAYEIEGT